MSGRTAEFLVTDADTVTAITQHVFDNWPSGMYLNSGFPLYNVQSQQYVT